MSVRMTSTCMSRSKAKYCAAVSARRGVINRSIAGASARVWKRTLRARAPRELCPPPQDLGLAGNLRRHLVMRQPRAGEERQLLAAHQGVQPVDARDAGLHELLRPLPGAG